MKHEGVNGCISEIENSPLPGKMIISKMSERQVIKLTNLGVKEIDILNSNGLLKDFRKIANRGETFIIESGV